MKPGLYGCVALRRVLWLLRIRLYNYHILVVSLPQCGNEATIVWKWDYHTVEMGLPKHGKEVGEIVVDTMENRI